MAVSSPWTLFYLKTNILQQRVLFFFAVFQDVHVMVFIGFGFLMTFLKRYGFSALGYNFLIAALVIQWATMMQGFFDIKDNKIKLGFER